MRLGVIDCGTNTFHILVADTNSDGTFHTVFKQRKYVRLGQEGLHRIGEAPFQRGVDCIHSFKNLMLKNEVQHFLAFGTEALRRADNGQDFIEAVRSETGVEIQLISGDEEARLIHLGVMQAVPPFHGKGLIMDIGGGSVEFIIASEEDVYWAQSFPLGVQVLFSGFQKNDPISQGDLLSLEWHLEQELQPLFKALDNHQTPLLFGASGSFEVIEDLLLERRHHPLYSVISTNEYYRVHGPIVNSSLQQRFAMSKIPNERAELIVVAFVLIDYIVRKAGIRQIITSAYAMKEGILYEMLKKQ